MSTIYVINKFIMFLLQFTPVIIPFTLFFSNYSTPFARIVKSKGLQRKIEGLQKCNLFLSKSERLDKNEKLLFDYINGKVQEQGYVGLSFNF